ncbi:MAG: hypothetical protein H8E46_06605 [FCB group bacterium]|nr:hypothetical protein [FCB group bacterium]
MNQNEFIIGLDVDGVLRNWVQTILQQVNASYDTRIFNKDISSCDLVPILKEQIPGFDEDALKGIHKRCAETGKLAEATAFKDGLTLFQTIFEAGFPIRLLTSQPVWARDAFYKWIHTNHLADKVMGIDFLPLEAKAKADVQLLIDDNPRVITAAAKSLKPSILWLRTWNKSWQYPGKDLPEDLIKYTVLPKKALQFIEYWEEKITEGI